MAPKIISTTIAQLITKARFTPTPLDSSQGRGRDRFAAQPHISEEAYSLLVNCS